MKPTGHLAAVTLIALLTIFAVPRTTHACTNVIVTPGASADGSMFVGYTFEGGGMHPYLGVTEAENHDPDDVAKGPWGEVEQAPQTFRYLHSGNPGDFVGLMNERQVIVAETTFIGRRELVNPKGRLLYQHMMRLALQRASTAREAIKVMTDLVDGYGYGSSGETFSIADPREAWIMEMVGPGDGGTGAAWVALRIPDGAVVCHANKARIGEFPMDDPENCLYSENVIDLAVTNGWYDPNSGEPFSFRAAYHPATNQTKRYSDGRVWSVFRRVAPSLDLSPGYFRGANGAKPYPLWVEPDEKLTTAQVFDLLRDHYEDTSYSMREGVKAGPFGMPDRWRPLSWEIDGEQYVWERPISDHRTAFSCVAQARSHLPDGIGGVLWYGVDTTYTTCYFPLYTCVTDVPQPFAVGNGGRMSWDSAWWVFNFVANFAGLRYNAMVEDVRKVQSELEGRMLRLQPAVESAAMALWESDRELAREYLTDYGKWQGERVADRWRELAEQLISKYNDGYVRGEGGGLGQPGYPEDWLRAVVRDSGEQLEVW